MRILFLIILVAVIAGAWWFSPRNRTDDALEVTVAFSSDAAADPGAPVLLGTETIGRVESVERSADGTLEAAVHVDASARGNVRTDSVWTVDPQGAIVVSNPLPTGPPLEDGARVRGGVNPGSEWIARGRSMLDRISTEAASLIQSTDSAAVERQFDKWTAELPQWKARGEKGFDEARERVVRSVSDAERKLRESGRVDDANRLRERLRAWLDETRDTSDEPPAGDSAAQ